MLKYQHLKYAIPYKKFTTLVRVISEPVEKRFSKARIERCLCLRNFFTHKNANTLFFTSTNSPLYLAPKSHEAGLDTAALPPYYSKHALNTHNSSAKSGLILEEDDKK